jgi:hypothetical protein
MHLCGTAKEEVESDFHRYETTILLWRLCLKQDQIHQVYFRLSCPFVESNILVMDKPVLLHQRVLLVFPFIPRARKAYGDIGMHRERRHVADLTRQAASVPMIKTNMSKQA